MDKKNSDLELFLQAVRLSDRLYCGMDKEQVSFPEFESSVTGESVEEQENPFEEPYLRVVK